MRVLVVEDEPEVRDLLCRVIRGVSWAVDTAPDGTSALAQLSGAEYDLAVLDVGLPDIDGFEVCRRLRRAGDRTPVLVLTARNAVDDRVRGLDAGADDYLAKPFDVGGAARPAPRPRPAAGVTPRSGPVHRRPHARSRRAARRTRQRVRCCSPRASTRCWST